MSFGNTGPTMPNASMSSSTVMKMKIAAPLRAPLGFIDQIQPTSKCLLDAFAIAAAEQVEQEAAKPGDQHRRVGTDLGARRIWIWRAPFQRRQPILDRTLQEIAEPRAVLERQ